MNLNEQFEKAAVDVKGLTSRPTNETLLELYAWYKQGTEGDVTGSRPGMLDLKGRKKYDAWQGVRGTNADEAKRRYIALVDKLLKS